MRAAMILWLGLGLGCGDRTPPPSEEPARPYYTDARGRANTPKAPPTLVEDMVAIPGGPFVGRNPACPKPGLASEDPNLDQRPDEPLRVAGFSIDRKVATCPQYAECVAAAACPPFGPLECIEDTWAVVGIDSALSYCRWRGARLPSYREWQRAIRGVDGDVFPTGKTLDEARSCERPTGRYNMRRCEHTSAAGVIYAVENGNYGEWTNEAGCTIDAKGAKVEVAITPKSLSRKLNQFTFHPMESEIRCARDAPATVAPAAR